MVSALSAMPSSFTPSIIAFASTTSSLSPSLAVKPSLLLPAEGLGCALAMDAHDMVIAGKRIECKSDISCSEFTERKMEG